MNVMRDLQVSFIEQKLKQGTGYSQLKKVFFEQYPTCSLRTFERRVVDAKARIKSELDMSKQISQMLMVDDISRNNLKLLDEMQIKDKLSRIALGEERTRNVMVKGKVVELKESADFKLRTDAIKTLLKMG
jgi:hypothetical protein